MKRSISSRRLCLCWIVVFAAVFLVIMPYVGQDLVYSVYRSRTWTYESMQEKVLDVHRGAVSDAEVYLRSLEWRSGGPLVPEKQPASVDVVMVVVTSRRVVGSRTLGYLSRTVAALHRLTADALWPQSKQLFVCDVNAGPASHLEADRLRQYFEVIVRFPRPNASAAILDPFEKEKQDYAFCLQRALQFMPRFVLIVEDDAVARDDLFMILRQVLHSETIESGTRAWSHLKLYYPERWQGFALDARTVLELSSLFCLVSTVCTFLLAMCWPRQRSYRHSVVAGFLAILVVIAVGRQHLIDLKRITPYLYSLAPDPGCCSPAVLYNVAFAKLLVPFLIHETRCSYSYPLDVALTSFVERLQWPGFRVEPNLFRHIGLISSIKGYSRHIEDFLLQ